MLVYNRQEFKSIEFYLQLLAYEWSDRRINRDEKIIQP